MQAVKLATLDQTWEGDVDIEALTEYSRQGVCRHVEVWAIYEGEV